MDSQTLKQAGLKITSPRVEVLKVLESSQNAHFSAEAIYRELISAGRDIGLATVYRVLTQFEEAGLVTRHNFEGDSAVFELDNGEHHDHLVCIQCGGIEEFVDDMIETQQAKIASEKGFQMTDHALTIYGVCGTCQD